LGCLGFVVLVAVAILITIEVNRRNAGKQAVRAVRGHLVQTIERSAMPDDQKRAAVGHIDRLAAGAERAGLESEQIEHLRQRVAESRAYALAVFWFVDRHAIARSSLTEDQKQDAAHQLRRFSLGVLEGRIERSALAEVYGPITEAAPDGARHLVPDPSPAQLVAFAAAMRRQADAAGVTHQPIDIDLGEQIGLVVDRLLDSIERHEPVPTPEPSEVSS